MADESLDDIPVRDKGNGAQADAKSNAQQKRVVEKWSRADIEDNYLQLYSENILLKQHGRKQEEKIKKMTTKLQKLSNDNKKLRESGGGPSHAVSKRDAELAEKVEDLNLKVLELQKENNLLKDKLAVAKQQIASQSKRQANSTYGYIGHRIDTGRGVRGDSARTPRNTSSKLEPLPRYGHSLLEEARDENAKLNEALIEMEERLQDAEREADHLKEQLRQQHVDRNEGIVKYKETVNNEYKSGIQENVEIIKLQREIKEKSTKFTSLQLQYQTLEENLRSVKSTNQNLLSELEKLNKDFQDENARNVDLQGKLRDDMHREKVVLEMQHRIQLLEQECNILKANNESLVKSALDTERDTASIEKERELRLEIAKLQAAMKGDLSDKGEILDKFHSESEAHEKLKSEMRQLQIEFYTVKQQYESAQEKVKFFTSQTGTDFGELEEALVLLRARKDKPSDKPEFVVSTDEEPSQNKVLDLEAQLADTVAELEKSRNMLLQQYNINKVYKKEVDASTQRVEEYKKEFEARAEEYARLLDIRQARIKKLEAQLKDVAYGTKPFKVQADTKELGDEDDDEILGHETLEIERGKNIFEIHVDRIALSEDAQKLLQDSQPSLFMTYGFHEFETQTTPPAKGPVAVFKFTSQFKVDMDDIFLSYLMKNACTFELHQAVGTDFRTLAAAKICFRDIFDHAQGRMYASAPLIGNSREGVEVYGTLEYSIRFIVPVEQALRLYSERVKAMGYSQINERADNEAIRILEGERDIEPGSNYLYVKVEQCSDLNSRLPDRQPSPYVVYKFFDFDDYDTPIINNSCNPQFSDNKSFKVMMSDALDNYLKSNDLELYVFDDSQESSDLSFLGVARVPLTELSHNRAIQGPYEIVLPDGKVNGSISVNLKWFSNYKSESVLRGEAQRLLAEREQEEAELAELKAQRSTIRRQPNEFREVEKEAKKVISRVEDEPIRAPVSTIKSESEMTVKEMPTKPEVTERSLRGSPKKVGFAENPVTKADMSMDSEVDEYVDEQFEEEENVAESPEPVQAETQVAPVARPRKGTLRARFDAKEPGETQEPGQLPSEQRENDELQTKEKLPIGEAKEGEKAEDEVLDSGGETTDSEQFITTKTMRSSIALEEDPNLITIVVHGVSLEKHCKAFKDPNLVALFVSYKFLDIPLEYTETPTSLEIPSIPDENIEFNFHKMFFVSRTNNNASREALKDMLLSGESDMGSKIRFDVVAEPKQDDGDCEDVGFVEVSVWDLLRPNKNIIEHDFDLQDAETSGLQVGTIKLSVKGLGALKSVYAELKEKKNRAK